MKTLILDNNSATIWVYPEKKIIHHKFKKFVYGDSFRDTMLFAADAFQQNKCTKWLSDDRENSALKSIDRDWAIEVWEPKVIKSGWKHWALVLPNLVVGQMNMKQIAARYVQLGINFKAFTDLEDALAWLEKQ